MPAPVMLPTELFQFLGPPGKPFNPFAAQADLFQRVKIPWPGLYRGIPYPRIFGICCGRRFGKTTLGEKLLWLAALAPDDRMGPPVVRLTADTEEHAMKIWRQFIFHLENTELSALKFKYEKEFELVTLHTGASIQMLSSYNPSALAGDGVTTWVIDEAQYLSQAAYDNLRPSTSDRSGVIIMLGVAQGEGPFKEVCFRGDDEDQPAFEHLTYATSANPYIPEWEVEFAKQTMAPHLFKQLYLAEWVSELGKVFWNIESCLSGDRIIVHPKGWGYTHAPEKGHVYYGGLDLARLHDYTVYTIWDAYGRLVAWDRFNAISWELQRQRILDFSATYGHPVTCVDSTGIGDPIFESLVDKGLNGVEYKISSNQAKRQLIDELAVRIGAGELRFPRVKTMINELSRMEAKQSTENTRLIRYEAPSGEHDDFPLSMSLAMQVLPRSPQVRVPAGIAQEEEERQIDVAELI